MGISTQEARAQFTRAQDTFRHLAETDDAPVGFTAPVEMGGDGTVLNLGEIIGRKATSQIDEIPRELRGKARVVLAADGSIKVIAGGGGEQLTVYDASQILDEDIYEDVLTALSRYRDHRRIRIGDALEQGKPETP